MIVVFDYTVEFVVWLTLVYVSEACCWFSFSVVGFVIEFVGFDDADSGLDAFGTWVGREIGDVGNSPLIAGFSGMFG